MRLLRVIGVALLLFLGVNGECLSPLFHELKDVCYNGSPSDVDFKTAQSWCEEISGQVVIVRSQEVQDFLNEKFTQWSYWIGAVKVDNLWKWKDNSSLIYTNWDTGEPNSNCPNCTCAIASKESQGKWKAVDCGPKQKDSHGAVCISNANHVTTTQTAAVTTTTMPITTTTTPTTTQPSTSVTTPTTTQTSTAATQTSTVVVTTPPTTSTTTARKRDPTGCSFDLNTYTYADGITNLIVSKRVVDDGVNKLGYLCYCSKPKCYVNLYSDHNHEVLSSRIIANGPFLIQTYCNGSATDYIVEDKAKVEAFGIKSFSCGEPRKKR